MIIIHSGRNPYAIFLLAACVLTGVAGLISPQGTSPVVAHLLAPWELEVWYGGLLTAAVTMLVGLAAHGLTSLLVERVGAVFVATLSAMYAVAVAIQGGATLSQAASLAGAFALASLARVWQIGRDLKQIPRP